MDTLENVILNIEKEQNINDAIILNVVNSIIKKRRPHRRGINKTLSDEEIKKKLKEKSRCGNKTYYIKNVEKMRIKNLENYYKKKNTNIKRGRPCKYEAVLIT